MKAFHINSELILAILYSDMILVVYTIEKGDDNIPKEVKVLNEYEALEFELSPVECEKGIRFISVLSHNQTLKVIDLLSLENDVES